MRLIKTVLICIIFFFDVNIKKNNCIKLYHDNSIRNQSI
jgi:hypothetical protein